MGLASTIKIVRKYISRVKIKWRLLLIAYLLFGVLLYSIFASELPNTSANIYQPIHDESIEEKDTNFVLGIDVHSVHNIDLDLRTFSAEGWVSLKWKILPDWLKNWDKEVESSPASTITLVNATNRSEFYTQVSPSTPYLDSDGNYIQWLEFSGQFYIDEINLRSFPFHQIMLPIEVELDDYFSTDVNLTLLRADNYLLGAKEFTGYNFDSDELIHSIRVYNTNFGLHESREIFGENRSEYDNAKLKIYLSRDFKSSLLLVFSPLIAAMIISLLTPFIHPKHYDTKVALPASVLLVLVFMQQSYQSMLPSTLGYMTFADYIYILSMFITLSIFIWSVVSSNKFLDLSGNKQELTTDRLKSSDRLFCLSTTIYFILMITLGYLVII